MTNTTINSIGFKQGFAPRLSTIATTDGKINIVINTMIDFMKGDITAEQFSNRLYRAFTMCLERRKFNDVKLNECVIHTTKEHIKEMETISRNVLEKFTNDYPEIFEE